MKNGNINFLISQRPIYQGAMAVKLSSIIFVLEKSPLSIQYVPLDIILKENMDYYSNFQELVANVAIEKIAG